MIQYRSPFDEQLATHGPPAIFTIDFKDRLGLDEARTRELWTRMDRAPEWGVCHCLYRDRETGWVQYVLVTSPDLCGPHPRADIVRFATREDALSALAALGELPVSKEPEFAAGSS